MSLKNGAKENIGLLHAALDGGINLFDTADLYDKGDNERLVGEAFREKRQQVIIATKGGNQWRPDGSGWDWNPSKAYILKAAEASLKRLQTDYIDLYQIHGGTIEDPYEETIEALEQLQQQGKILHWGISSIRPNVVRRWAGHGGMTSVMVQYSLLDRRPEETILPLLAEKGIGVLARGALAQGLLLGKAPKQYLEQPESTVASEAAAVTSAASHGFTPTGLAINWVLHHPAVTSVVAGIRTQHHLDAALAAMAQPPLPQQTAQSLAEAAPALVYQQHR
jgi:aryl-alcohol dehydrogenase-like predicted oxidoreductase